MQQPSFKPPSVVIAVALIASAYAELPTGTGLPTDCNCESHEVSEPISQTPSESFTEVLELPEGFPEACSIKVLVAGDTLTLQLKKNRVFGKNTRVLIDDGTGTLIEHDPGPDRYYLGTVVERPDFSVCATRTEDGLIADIFRPGEEPIKISPHKDSEIGGMHKIGFGIPGEYVSTGSTNPTEPCASCVDGFCGSDHIAPSTGPIGLLAPFLLSSNVGGNVPAFTATLPPSTVLDIYEYEVGVEIGSRAFFASSAYNGSLDAAMNVVQGIPGNLDDRFLRSAGVKHRLGTVLIRTNVNTDPLRDSVTISGGGNGATGSLNAFRDYWNNNPDVVGNTHDLAVYHVFSPPSGLAYVNSVGSGNRYATSAGRGSTSWANSTLAHEFGHSWNLFHPNNSLFYESSPRDADGSDSAGGEESPFSIMGGSNIGRVATDEAQRVFNARQNRRGVGDLIPVSELDNVRPYPRRDEAISTGSAIIIDVIENDLDVNNDVLDLRLLDTVSREGGTIAISQGTGPGGRNEILYTPPPTHTGVDFFHYWACEVESGGLRNWGAVYVTNFGPVVVDLSQENYHYDLGDRESPLQSGLVPLTHATSGEINWSGDPVSSRDRGNGSWGNGNRDFVTGDGTSTLNHKLATGLWRVSMSLGDATGARDQIRVNAEDGQIVRDNISSLTGQFSYVEFDVDVADGELNLELSDQGGATNGWSINRLRITRPPIPSEAVVVTRSASRALPNRGDSYSLPNFNPGGANKLVVTTSAEGRDESRSVTGITFRGIPLTEIISSTGIRSTAIWYLENPGTSAGPISVTWSGETNGCGIAAYALFGAAPDTPVAIRTADSLSLDVTTPETNSVIITSLVANGGSAPTIAAPYDLGYGADIGSATGAAASYGAETAGTSTLTYSTSGATPVLLAAVFRPNRPQTHFIEANGTVTMEAESFLRAEARNTLPHRWQFDDTAPGYVGSGYMEIPDGSVGALGDYPNGARMLYEVDFSSLGDYDIYVRRRALGGASNSVFAGIDGAPSPAFDNGGAAESWTWISLGEISVSSAGVRPVDIVLREDGYQVDRIVLTTGSAPSGDGPPESSRFVPPQPIARSFLELNGQVTMEAEHFERREARDNAPLLWTLATTDSGYVGEGYMEIPDDASGFFPTYENGSRMIYDVDFDRTGTYDIYLRRRAIDGGTNSVFAGFDDMMTDRNDNGPASPDWVWADLGDFTVDSPGVYPIDIALREDGYQVDRIVISSIGTPIGFGPAESPQRNTDDFDTAADDDGDGLSNGYEFRYFGHITAIADEQSDRDGDGSSDLNELIAGTDPNDNRSFFRISHVSRSEVEVTVEWESVVGKTYSIDQSDDLSGENWFPAASNIPSQGSSTSHTIAIDGGRQFFRVRVSG